MPQINLRSAGVTAREIDLTGLTSAQPSGVPAAVISPTQKGPAFVPVVVPNMSDYVVKFGPPTADFKLGPLAASEWLTYQQSFLQLRTLGIGDGTQRTTTGNNQGRVAWSGFIVGDQQPQSSLSGALGSNAYAVTSSTGPTATGPLGRTYFLAACMSQSAGSSYFSDAVGANTAIALRSVIMASSGTIITLSASNVNSAMFHVSAAADLSAGTVAGSPTGSVNLQAGRQEFILLLNGHKGTTQYPRVITASFDMTATNYVGNVLNKDPLKLEEAGHYLYSCFDIHSTQAVVTGSGVIVAASGSGGLGSGFERIAFLVTGSQTRNLGSATAPNFEGFEDRYKTASSPWIISQKFGGTPVNLFKVHALDDGEYPNDKIKVSIENVSPSTTDTTLYGSFDLIVRDYGDTDGNKSVLEAWRGLTIDPTSDKYVAKAIGDYRTFFNFDAAEGRQLLHTTGDYPNKSKYVRVEVTDDLANSEVDATALPMGFRGTQHLVTSGSAAFAAHADTLNLLASNPFYSIVQPPVPMRQNLNKGVSPSQTADRNLYWGIQFEKVISVTEPNSSNRPNTNLLSFNKYYPNYHTTYMNVVVRDNEGTADTAANSILDADRFNNNQFSLEKIRVVYNATSLLPDTSQLTSWAYVRAGGITTDTTALTRAMTVDDLKDASTRSVARFTLFLEGGFDGTRPFNSDTKLLTNKAVVEEMLNTNRGLSTNGPTVKAYTKAVDVVKDTSEVDIQLLAIPDIRHQFVTDTAVRAMEVDRFDAMYLMDIEERDTNNLRVSGSSQLIGVKNTVTDFRNRGVNSSFAAAYFPDVNIRNSFTNTVVRVPPSVAVLGAIARNDAIGHPWYAPAGTSRASLATTQDIVLRLSRQNMDDLYAVSINPLVAFPQEGPVVWGQKTLLAKSSVLDRVNVRRLMISLRREVKAVSNRILFEQNRETTLAQFSQLVNPILKRVQDQKGLEAYSVQINTQTTTQADIENKTIKGKIFVIPTKSLEFLSLDFVLSNQIATVTG